MPSGWNSCGDHVEWPSTRIEMMVMMVMMMMVVMMVLSGLERASRL